MTRQEEMVYRMALGDLGVSLPNQIAYFVLASVTGTTITLPLTVAPGTIVTVQKNGIWLYEGVDFTVAGQIITFASPYVSNDVIRCYYFV